MIPQDDIAILQAERCQNLSSWIFCQVFANALAKVCTYDGRALP